MNHSRKLPEAKKTGVTWTYWVSRDSLNGELNGKCSLWRTRPLRVKHRYRVTWVGADDKNPGHLGEYDPQTVLLWFHVYPETDLELVRIDQNATPRMLEAAKKAQRGCATS